MEIPEAQPIEAKPTEPEAILSEGAWSASETRFHEEAQVSVKLTLPPGKEHLTRVEAELYAQRDTGPELIAKGEGNAVPYDTAVITLPVYKPQNHQGEIVEYFLAFKHKLAKVFQPESLRRMVKETALKSADHSLVPGIVFEPDTSFIKPKVAEGLKALESKVKEWEKAHPKGKIVVYGHANPDEKDAKALRERRAQSAHAFITNDADIWEKLYGTERWGLRALQLLLKDLKLLHKGVDGLDGPDTQQAFKAVQKKAGLPETGKEDAATRKALFKDYMQGKHDIKIEAGRFRTVAGNPWMGCAGHNLAKEGKEPENRRVAFILINESKFFPIHFPCQDGNEAGCQGQCKKAGKRATAGVRCAFYDELVREQAQAHENESNQDNASHAAFVKFSSSLDSGRQKILSGKSVEIIGKAAKAAGLESVMITSTIRYPHQQAEAMYTNLSNGKRLSYAAPGQAVTEVYDKCHKDGLDKEATLKKMVEKINSLSEEGKRVSKHCVSEEEYGRLNIADIGIPAKNIKEFIIELAKDDAVEKIFHDIKTITDSGKIARLAKEPCIHVEIKQ